jgi:hypothetical protein
MSNFPLKPEQDIIERRRSIQKTGAEQLADTPRSSVSAIAVCVKSRDAGTVLNRDRMRRTRRGAQIEGSAGR